jgi:broad specificity phosphatase PhoE
MPRIKLFLIRHSKSCSNHVREGESDDDISKGIRDPGLSTVGFKNARRYGPVLRKRLASVGFDTGGALITASTLRRAQDTAFLIFGRRPSIVPHFAENGKIPENTPEGHLYAAPQWPLFVKHLSTLVGEGDSVAVVGHGSYLRSLWPRLTGFKKTERLNNLDGILLEADIGAHGLKVHSFKEIPYRGPSFTGVSDQCSVRDTRKIGALRRDMGHKQRGGNGSAGMPLAYFQDGAQLKGTFGEPTGVGLANPTTAWVRPPLNQTGGSRRFSKKQGGGFSPSIMGGFASNGARLIPVAAYMGYNMYSNQKKTRRAKRKSRRGTRKH